MSATTIAAGICAITVWAWEMSASWPALKKRLTACPASSTTAWSLVFIPPLVRPRACPAWPPGGLLAANPLSKVPCLLTEDGVALYDSPLICEYLDSVGDAPPLFPDHGAARWQALRNQALADGIMEAAVLARMESARPEEAARTTAIARQKAAVQRGIEALEGHVV